MAGGLEASPDVGPCDDDGLSGEVLFWVRETPELVVEEGDDEVANSSVSPKTSFPMPELARGFVPDTCQLTDQGP